LLRGGYPGALGQAEAECVDRAASESGARALDDLDILDAARRDPEALVGGDEPVTLDEIERAGLLLHTGRALEWPAPDMLAAPWWRVL